MPARITWATCGSACEGNMTVGIQALGGRKLLFQPRQNCARATQHQRDCEGANQKAATQVVHSVAKQQRQALIHGSLSSSVVGQNRAYKEEKKKEQDRRRHAGALQPVARCRSHSIASQQE